MERTKLFLSYSHMDREWFERLTLHLALLERRGFVHVWSDTRIGVGGRWQEEIEGALTESTVAVLLVSPGFLASAFIWEEEIPRILNHQAAGMRVFPLIARPCAWRLAPELAALQARPRDGRPLSMGNEAEVDRDLAEFVIELAAILGEMSGGGAAREMQRLREQGLPSGPLKVVSAYSGSAGMGVDAGPPGAEGEAAVSVAGTWVGTYQPTNRQLRLVVEDQRGPAFDGEMHYADDRTVTRVGGRTVDQKVVCQHPTWIDMRVDPGDGVGVVFEEMDFVVKGKEDVQLGGEYRGLISRNTMVGVWASSGRALGRFEFQRAGDRSESGKGRQPAAEAARTRRR